MTKLTGGSGSDTLVGTTGGDTILGYQGDDSLTGVTGSPNLLVDGSFETAPVAANTWTHFSTVGGWQSDTGIEVWGKGFIHNASDGNQAIELDYDNRFSKVWQDVKTEAGHAYTLSLDTAARPGTDMSVGSNTNGINIYWNGQLVQRIAPGSTDWQHSTFTVIGSGGTDRLEFREDAGKNDSLGGLIDNVKLTADGHNMLYGGTGNDTLAAGNHGDLLVGGDAKSGDVDMGKMKAVDTVTAHVSFDGSGAGYHNAVGMYTYDNAGNITGVKMIYADVSGNGVAHGSANPDVQINAGDHFGFFVASNAFNQSGNAALLTAAGGSFKLVDAKTGGAANVSSGHEMNLVYVAADGQQTVVKTEYGKSLFTTDTGDNGDGFQHAHVSVDPSTGKLSVKFEDLWGGGDKNFYDANFSVDIGSTSAVQLAHAGVGSAHAAKNDDLLVGADGNDTLVGLSGNDTLHGGLGSNKLFGGSGDDRFVANGGNDTIVGGSGNDLLDLSNATHGVTVDLSKHIVEGFGHDVVRGVESLIGTAFGDVIKGDKAANSINAGAGNDVVRGFTGADVLTGGAGDDKFVWQLKDVVDGAWHSKGVDQIVDFGNGNDVLDLHKLFSGIKGDHASLVSLTDSAQGTDVSVTIGGHHVDVAMLDGVHGATVAALVAGHDLLI